MFRKGSRPQAQTRLAAVGCTRWDSRSVVKVRPSGFALFMEGECEGQEDQEGLEGFWPEHLEALRWGGRGLGFNVDA